MSQFGYYLVIILLGVGNLALAMIAYRQRDKQIQGNALRVTQVELAELRNGMAEQRVEYLREEVELLREIRDGLVGGGAEQSGDSAGVTRAAPSSRRATRPLPVRTSLRSSSPPHAPA